MADMIRAMELIDRQSYRVEPVYLTSLSMAQYRAAWILSASIADPATAPFRMIGPI